MRNKIVILILSLLFLFGLFVYEKLKFDDGKLHVVFCNVGQGDAIFIRTPKGSDILIDGGPDDSVLKCLSSHMPFYDRDLELVFLTHPHADHLSGLIDVIKRYNTLYFATEGVGGDSSADKSLKTILKEKNIKQKFIYKGDTFKTADGLTFRTLWPSKSAIDNSETSLKDNKNLDKNSFSLIQLLSYKANNDKILNILLTGDVQAEILNQVLKDVDSLDILKVAHHGSKTGTDSKSFDHVTPKIAVISVGKNNRYKLPSSSVVALLKSKGIKLERTDVDGEVEFSFPGSESQ